MNARQSLDPAGELGLVLRWDARQGQIASVEIAHTRPLLAARLLPGRSPAEVRALLPALFALCPQGQGAAAALALGAAQGEDLGEELENWRARLGLETLGEILWRFALDWPQALGFAPAPALLAQVRRIIASALNASRPPLPTELAELSTLIGPALLGMSPAEFLQVQSAERFDAWIEGSDSLAALTLAALRKSSPTLGTAGWSPLPGLDAELLYALAHQARENAQFAGAPRWQSAPAETGALARQCGEPLIRALLERDGALVSTRLAARLVELARLLADPATPRDWLCSITEPGDWGVAGVQTARGLLVHVAQVRDGRVIDYRIVAPTEWNFSGQGPLASGLTGQSAACVEQAQELGRAWVQALDPCVACRIEVVHA